MVLLLLGYLYFRIAGEAYALVSIGLISFAAVAQFAPVVLGGMYWRGGTREGALVLSVITAVTLAPGLLIYIDDRWIPAPLPALPMALLDGSARLLFPVPVFSMAICAAIMFYLLGGGRTKSASGDGE